MEFGSIKELPEDIGNLAFHNSWSASAHGMAADDPEFVTAWEEQGKPFECMACHTTGYDFRTQTWKDIGVTCEACHGPFTEDHPLNPMPSDRSPELCGSCHQETLFEWNVSTHRQAQMDWESGMKAAVKVNGTLNKRTDVDKGWTVELKLPLSAVKGRAAKPIQIPPKVGDKWRANLFRMDVPKGKPRQASAWSPPHRGDFHTLDRFGTLVFADPSGSVGPSPDKKKPADARKPAPAPRARPR